MRKTTILLILLSLSLTTIIIAQEGTTTDEEIPTLLSITPNTLTTETGGTLTLTGEHIGEYYTLTISGVMIDPALTTRENENTITFPIEAGTPKGTYNIALQTLQGTSNSITVTITEKTTNEEETKEPEPTEPMIIQPTEPTTESEPIITTDETLLEGLSGIYRQHQSTNQQPITTKPETTKPTITTTTKQGFLAGIVTNILSFFGIEETTNEQQTTPEEEGTLLGPQGGEIDTPPTINSITPTIITRKQDSIITLEGAGYDIQNFNTVGVIITYGNQAPVLFAETTHPGFITYGEEGTNKNKLELLFLKESWPIGTYKIKVATLQGQSNEATFFITNKEKNKQQEIILQEGNTADLKTLTENPTQWSETRNYLDTIELSKEADITTLNTQGIIKNINTKGITTGITTQIITSEDCKGTQNTAIINNNIENIHTNNGHLKSITIENAIMQGRSVQKGVSCMQTIEETAKYASNAINTIRQQHEEEIEIGAREQYPYTTINEMIAWIEEYEQTGETLDYFDLEINEEQLQELKEGKDYSITVGKEITVFDESEDSCSSWDAPDGVANAIRDKDGMIQVTSSVNRRMIGPTLETLKSSKEADNCRHLLPEPAYNPDPAKFNDGLWLGSRYTEDGQNVYGIVHTEYHGNWHEPNPDCWKTDPESCQLCKVGISEDVRFFLCWYGSIGFASSTDKGATFNYPGSPPEHLLAAVPYKHDPNIKSHYGIGENTNVIKKDGYYYVTTSVFYPKHTFPAGRCLMRTNDITDPDSWRFWDGKDYTTIMPDPYRVTTDPNYKHYNPNFKPEEHICKPIKGSEIGPPASSLYYSDYLGEFVSPVHRTLFSKEGDPIQAFQYVTSKNLLEWKKGEILWDTTLKADAKTKTLVHPSFIEDKGTRNFEVIGRTPYFSYVVLPKPNTLKERDMKWRKISITKPRNNLQDDIRILKEYLQQKNIKFGIVLDATKNPTNNNEYYTQTKQQLQNTIAQATEAERIIIKDQNNKATLLPETQDKTQTSLIKEIGTELEKTYPTIETLTKTTLYNDQEQNIEITGKHFDSTTTAKLGTEQLQATYKDKEHLIIKIPKEKPKGTYTLQLDNGKKSNTATINIKEKPTITTIEQLEKQYFPGTWSHIKGEHFEKEDIIEIDLGEGYEEYRFDYQRYFDENTIGIYLTPEDEAKNPSLRIRKKDETKSNDMPYITTQNSETTTIENDNIKLTFTYNGTALYIEKIENKQQQKIFTTQNTSLTQIITADTSITKTTQDLGIQPHEYNSKKIITPTGEQLQFYFNNTEINTENNLNITLTVELPTNEESAQFNIQVNNNMKDYTLESIEYPRIIINQLSTTHEEEALILPWLMGTLQTAPRKKAEPTQTIIRLPTPAFSQTFTYQITGYYNTKENIPVIYGTRDKEGYTKNIIFYYAPKGIGWGVEHIPENHNIKGTNYQSPYSTSIGTITGDWYDIAQYYRKWAIPTMITRGKIETATTGLSSRYHDIDLHVMLGFPELRREKQDLTIRQERARVAGMIPKEAKELKDYYNLCPDPDMPEYECDPTKKLDALLIEYYAWHNNSHLDGQELPAGYREVQPEIMEATKQLQQQGNLVIGYTNHMGYDITGKDYNTNINQYMAQQRNGNYITQSGPGPTVQLHFPNPATTWWKNLIKDYMIDLLDFGDDNPQYQGTGLDGAYWDVWSTLPPALDYSKRTEHPQGGGNYWLKGEKEKIELVRKETQKIKPQTIIESEHLTEYHINDLDFTQHNGPFQSGYLGQSPIRDTYYSIPLYTTIYGEYATFNTIIATGPNITKIGTTEFWNYLWASYFNYGMFPSAGNDRLNTEGHTFPLREQDKAFWNLHKQIVRTNLYAKEFIQYGKRLRPLTIQTATTDITTIPGPPSLITNHYTEHTPNIPNVLGSAWKASNNEVALLFINWKTTEQTATINNLDLTKYDLEKDRTYYLTEQKEKERTLLQEITNSLTTTIDIPKHSIKILVLTTDNAPLKDDDKDGIPNNKDKCPKTPDTYKQRVNTNGCPKPLLNKFTSTKTSNLDRIEDLKKIIGLQLGIRNKGLITFTEELSILRQKGEYYEPLNLEQHIDIEKNNITINTVALPELNKKARLTFYQTGYENPVIRKDGTICKEPLCTLEEYEETTKNFIIGVQGFSNYNVTNGTCGDNYCSITENANTCTDCAVCGNDNCEAGETTTNCAQDCKEDDNDGGGGSKGGKKTTQKILKLNLDTNGNGMINLSGTNILIITRKEKEYHITIRGIASTYANLYFNNLTKIIRSYENNAYSVDLNKDGKEDITYNIGILGGTRISMNISAYEEKEPTIITNISQGTNINGTTQGTTGEGKTPLLLLLLIALPIILALGFTAWYLLKKNKELNPEPTEQKIERIPTYENITQ